MSKRTAYITRHTLSSLFEDSLKLLKPTWKASLIACAIVFVPMAILSAFFIQSYFGLLVNLMGLTGSSSADIPSILQKFLPFMGFVLLYSIIASIAGAFASAVVSRNAFKAASGESSVWKDLMGEILREKFGKLVVFLVLETLAILGAVLVSAVVLGLLIALVAVKKLVALMVILIVIAYLGLILAALAAQAIFQFGPPIIANEGSGGAAAFGKCFTLVKGQFWRVLGIGLLFSMALSFAVSMVTMPLQFASIAPIYVKLLESLLSGNTPDSSELLMEMATAFKSAGVFIALLIAVQNVLEGMVTPLFTTLFYADLRVRKGDLADADAPAPAPDQSGQAQV